MEKKILKNNITMKELKRQLENIIEEIDRTEKDKYFTPPMINEMISCVSLGNKKKLEELAAEEVLEKLVNMITEEKKEIKDAGNFNLSAEKLGNIIYFSTKNNSPKGYFNNENDDIRALEGIKFHEGEIFEKAYLKIKKEGKFLDDIEMFGELMRNGFVLILEQNIQVLVSEKLIEDSNNLKFNDLKIICNKIARDLKTEIPFKKVEIDDGFFYAALKSFVEEIEDFAEEGIETKEATEFIRGEFVDKANEIFESEMVNYEKAMCRAKYRLLNDKYFIKRIKKLNR